MVDDVMAQVGVVCTNSEYKIGFCYFKMGGRLGESTEYMGFIATENSDAVLFCHLSECIIRWLCCGKKYGRNVMSLESSKNSL